MMKRVFDILLSLLLIIILSPIFVLQILMVWIKLGQPVIFRQLRPGMHGRPFYLYKFRTMLEKRDFLGNLLSDDQRITSFGSFLRSTSLDELPEFFNVLKGEMSLVGPRPLLMSYLPLYSPEQARRHEVRPGITGWAQVNGRNAIGWNEKFSLDVWYVDNRSFLLDVKILWMTLIIVLKRKGISQQGKVTMELFKGNRP